MSISALTPSTVSLNSGIANYQKTIQNIASGKKVNGAADNPAALAILTGLQSQKKGLDQAVRNTQDSISLLNTAEGAMSGSSDAIQRMRELSVQASNGTLTSDDQNALQLEMNQVGSQVNANASTTQFNGIYTNNGTLSDFATQTGANSGQNVNFSISDLSANNLGINTISIVKSADTSITKTDDALSRISSARASVGTQTNALQASSQTSTQASGNLTSADSSTGDSDIAAASTQLVLTQVQQYVNVMIMSQQKNQPKGLSILA